MRTPSAPAAAESGITILVLALLLSIQPVTTDLYLPALPTLTLRPGGHRDAGAAHFERPAAGLWLLPAFLGAAVRPLGPPAHFAGRTALYTLASMGNALAAQHGSAHPVAYPARGGHGRGGDVRAGHRARPVHPVAGARAMSKALTGLGVVACLCAPIGGWLADGWAGALPCWR